MKENTWDREGGGGSLTSPLLVRADVQRRQEAVAGAVGAVLADGADGVGVEQVAAGGVGEGAGVGGAGAAGRRVEARRPAGRPRLAPDRPPAQRRRQDPADPVRRRVDPVHPAPPEHRQRRVRPHHAVEQAEHHEEEREDLFLEKKILPPRLVGRSVS